MPTVVSVRFKPVTKVYFFDVGNFNSLDVGVPVIVETARGEELGWVAASPAEISEKEVKGKLKPVKRLATPLDLMSLEENRARENNALEKCRARVRELGLPMKIISADYNYDGSRLMFSFTSEQRVDFRKLVRELARSFRTRIEMKQIGARDESKIVGGYGRCGRQLCCSSWLTEFHPVSIRMAKQQSLPLAPSEISGLCGRLLCCLAYENEMYADLRQTLPNVGAKIKTPEGVGVVRGLNILSQAVILMMDSGTMVEVPASEVTVIAEGKSRRPRPKKKNRPKK
ncbi:MAG: stage 0 sporulation family protein [Anaerolineae bacterium]